MTMRHIQKKVNNTVHNYSLNEEHVTPVTHDDSDPQDRIMRMHGQPSG